MKKIELRIIGLSYSATQAGSFCIVLGETKGNLKLPVIIKPTEALYIEMKMQGLSPKRPLTHDVFKKMTDALGADVQQVHITNFLEGVFHTKVILSNMVDEFEIECGIGDAIALALVYKCQIFCNKEVLKLYGIEMDDDGSISDEQYESNHRERDYSQGVTVENLEKMLDKALENEEYEIASQLRDRINELKEETK